ncbi:MAG: biopolymer transporter ExbD [Pirellulaceae bacterium]|nr:biopolymer transporter ExbD [Pirellulaceae bacterium]
MRIPSRVASGEVGFNMTPMIDVVFQLIIFFLLSSHLAKQENQLALPLPTAQSGRDPVADDKPRLTVNVTLNGTLLVANRAVTPDELTARLRERLAAHGGDLEVRIRSDRSVAYAHVEPIMLACARAGIWNVSYAVYRREDVP